MELHTKAGFLNTNLVARVIIKKIKQKHNSPFSVSAAAVCSLQFASLQFAVPVPVPVASLQLQLELAIANGHSGIGRGGFLSRVVYGPSRAYVANCPVLLWLGLC